MSMVRFAALCDRCGVRSDEYTPWPTCRECGDDICRACLVPGTETEPDVDSPVRCLCRACDEADTEPERTPWSVIAACGAIGLGGALVLGFASLELYTWICSWIPRP